MAGRVTCSRHSVNNSARNTGLAGKWQKPERLGKKAFSAFIRQKNLGAPGDAGMIVCRDAQMANKLRILRDHGMEISHEAQRYVVNAIVEFFR